VLTALPGWSDAWTAFADHRRRKRAALTDRACDLIWRKLASRPADAVAALDMAIEAGWTGVEWDWYDRRRAGSSGAAPGPGARPGAAEREAAREAEAARAVRAILESIRAARASGVPSAAYEAVKAARDKFRDTPRYRGNDVVDHACWLDKQERERGGDGAAAVGAEKQKTI
jgi:hypothetical protein